MSDSVLHLLEHDGYLERRNGGYRFVSGLLEDWWSNRHGRHFVPVFGSGPDKEGAGRMTVNARKYNPGFLSDDELVALFCVRTGESSPRWSKSCASAMETPTRTRS